MKRQYIVKLEKIKLFNESQRDELANILNLLSNKPSGNTISQKEVILLESKESE